MNVVTIENLSKDYGETKAIDRASWTLPEGQLLGFLGPNGAGKTTTIRILMGLLKPSAGQAAVFGLDAWKQATRIRTRVGYLPGDIRLYDHFTGAQTVAFVARARRLREKSEAHRLAERFQLDLHKRVRTFSKGMKQKLGIIIAMMHKPDLYIMDEPTASLDPLMQQVLYRELRDATERGATVLFSSHSLPEVEHLCDGVVILRDGCVVASKPIDELRKQTGQSVRLRLRDSSAADAHPDGLTVKRSDNGTLEGYWHGKPDTLLRWLATLPLDEVVIQPPDLEDLFLSFYAEEEPAQ